MADEAHYFEKSADQMTMAEREMIRRIGELVDERNKLGMALENLLSADPDMPTYQADVDEAEELVTKWREEIGGI